MSERITRANLDKRVNNLNRRMERRGSKMRYEVGGRNGYIGLDRYAPDERRAMEGVDTSQNGWLDVYTQRLAELPFALVSNVMCGTMREVADFLHAGMVVLDDLEFYA